MVNIKIKLFSNGQFDVSKARYTFEFLLLEKNHQHSFKKLTENIEYDRTKFNQLPLPRDVDLIYRSFEASNPKKKRFELQLVRARDSLPVGKLVTGYIFKSGLNEDYYSKVNEMRMRAKNYYDKVFNWEADKMAGRTITEWPTE